MKKIIIGSLIVALLAVIFGIIFLFIQQSKPKSLGKITYGYEVWPGVLPYLVAYEKGFFKEQGLDVEMVKAESYTQEMEDFISGKVDFIGDFALIDLVKKVNLGEKIKVVLATDYSNGADGIVLKKEIKSIGDLKGKKVAVEIGTLGEYLLFDALKKNNLNLDDIQEVNLSAQEASQAFIRGEVVAAVTYEPNLSQAIEEGSGWSAYTSAESPGLIVDSLVFKSDFLDKNPEKVMAVMKAYFKAVDFITINPNYSYEVGAKYFDITVGDVKGQLAGIKQVNLFENQRLMTFGTVSGSLHRSILQAGNFLFSRGLINEKVDSTDILVPKFIRDIK